MIGGVSNIKKSGDGGFDGYLTFPLSDYDKKKGVAIIEVKSGNVGVQTIRAFMDVVEKQKADIGIFVCFEEQVSSGMRIEANNKGKIGNSPKIQIVTVEDLLNGKLPSLPYMNKPKVFKQATQKLEKKETDESLFG
jgi:site-specific DNA-methyltransferase (adenine-specific)